MINILLIDDEPDILTFLSYQLKVEGYQVSTATNGKEALASLEKQKPDLLVLDIMLPDITGYELCKTIRENATLKPLPILMLTARTKESDEIQGLEAGADDYLTKPVSSHLLKSRVRALLRRTATIKSPSVAQVGNLKIDKNAFLAERIQEDGTSKILKLPKKEFELLFYLITNPGKVFTRQELLNQVWGSETYVVDRTIDVHIRKLREKIGDSYIHTVKGVGYKFQSN